MSGPDKVELELERVARRVTEEIFSTPMGNPLTADDIIVNVLERELGEKLRAAQEMHDWLQERGISKESWTAAWQRGEESK